MVVFPNAKINIGLQITSKRPDGYHNLQSCFYPVGLCDILEVVPSPNFEMTFSGLDIPGSWQDNLLFKAFHMVGSDFQLPNVHIHLHKVIPMGAGLGGGSSDAAFLLKALNELFSLGLTPNILHVYAKRLGADCAFFIENKPVYAVEKGDVFQPITLSLAGKHILIVHPKVHVGTAEAYSKVTPRQPETPLNELLTLPIEQWQNSIQNDFEPSVFAIHPNILELKTKIQASGAIYTSMTGSGSAVVGIFEQAPLHLMDDSFQPFFCWTGELS